MHAYAQKHDAVFAGTNKTAMHRTGLRAADRVSPRAILLMYRCYYCLPSISIVRSLTSVPPPPCASRCIAYACEDNTRCILQCSIKSEQKANLYRYTVYDMRDRKPEWIIRSFIIFNWSRSSHVGGGNQNKSRILSLCEMYMYNTYDWHMMHKNRVESKTNNQLS